MAGLARIPIRKLMVANRGEIACRIFRTCRKLGIRTVAVYSEADAHSPHVKDADEAVCIGPAAALESYLNIAVLVATAKRVGADAIHPGYGFLSENALFANAVIDAGLNFVGPLGKTMEDLGNKKHSKDLLGGAAADVPLVPGYNGDDQSIAKLKSEIARIGCPVLIKAAAGGGGKGMRVVNNLDEAEEALNSVKLEAKNSFNNEQVLLEAYLTGCRHIEFQIFGDNYGNVVHFGERDCSVQRRHQKVIEETPSPFVSADLRERMGRSAVRIGELVKYRNAGTVEFLVDQQGRHYFLEVNTRLQVEHPVTEIVNGLDLVQLQLEIAQGFTLEELGLTGRRTLPVDTPKASIECRLYAEDPTNDFFPCTGPLLTFLPKELAGVRYDSGVTSGSVVSVYYDPMITKIIASGPSRRVAVDRMIAAIEGTVVLGLVTNKSFLLSMLRSKAFYEGNYDTTFIPKYFTPDIRDGLSGLSAQQAVELAVVGTLYDWMRRRSQQPHLRHISSGFSNTRRTFRSSSFVLSTVKGSPKVEVQYQYDNTPVPSLQPGASTPLGRARPHSFNVKTVITRGEGKEEQVTTEATPFRVSLLSADLRTGALSVEVKGVRRHYYAAFPGDMPLHGVGRTRGAHDDEECTMFVHADTAGSHTLLRQSRFGSNAEESGSGGLVKAQQTCKILSVEVATGDVVKRKQVIMVSESMKMVTKLVADVDGKVEIFARAGQVADGGAKLYSITPLEAPK